MPKEKNRHAKGKRNPDSIWSRIDPKIVSLMFLEEDLRELKKIKHSAKSHQSDSAHNFEFYQTMKKTCQEYQKVQNSGEALTAKEAHEQWRHSLRDLDWARRYQANLNHTAAHQLPSSSNSESESKHETDSPAQSQPSRRTTKRK